MELQKGQLYMVELLFQAKESITGSMMKKEMSGLMLIDTDKVSVNEFVKSKTNWILERLNDPLLWEEVSCVINNIEAVESDFFFDSQREEF
ncbi:MAG: hypothetical protein ACRC6R_10190 [Bacteroidales bacterium]